MFDTMWVFKDHKNRHVGLKFIILCDFYKKIILVDIRKWTINNVGRCSRETMNINGNTLKQIISKRKATHKLISQRVVNELTFVTLNPLSSFLTTSFVRIFSFFSASIFSFFCFFVGRRPLNPLKFMNAWSKPL